MNFQRQLLCALTTLLFALLCQQTLAEVLNAADNTINNLYDTLLQREYAGPVVFPNHQVERKAQRSPSLRLRFGRRSDPSVDALMPSAEKRWFGDVNQKPIRSPSLRLRFGRRSDPAMPLHSSFDALMNNLASDENTALDYNDIYGFDGGYERVVRKPQRLRWGRSVPFEGAENSYADETEQRQRSDDYLNSLVNTQKMRNMLLALHQYDADTAAALSAEDASDEFEREVRKPGLRLRWGRSTGGRSAAAVSEKEATQKKSLSPNALTGEKSPEAATQIEHDDKE